MWSVSLVLDDIASQSPEAVLKLVTDHYATIDCSRIEWHDLAEAASSLATCSSKLDDNALQLWATIAVMLFDKLAQTAIDRSDQYAYEESSMSLRAFMIDRYGVKPRHPLLDPAPIEEWFFSRFPKDLQDVMTQAKPLAELTTQDVLRILSFKDRLRMLQSLQLNGVFQRNEDLAKWFQWLEQSHQ